MSSCIRCSQLSPERCVTGSFLQDSVAACKLVHLLSNHMSSWGYQVFSLGLDNGHFRIWERNGIKTVTHLFHSREKRFFSFQELCISYAFPNAHFLPYCQLMGFVRGRIHNLNREFSSNLVYFLMGSPSGRHSLSSLYVKLSEETHLVGGSGLFFKWEIEFLDADLSQKTLKGWSHIRKTVIG